MSGSRALRGKELKREKKEIKHESPRLMFRQRACRGVIPGREKGEKKDWRTPCGSSASIIKRASLYGGCPDAPTKNVPTGKKITPPGQPGPLVMQKRSEIDPTKKHQKGERVT